VILFKVLERRPKTKTGHFVAEAKAMELISKTKANIGHNWLLCLIEIINNNTTPRM